MLALQTEDLDKLMILTVIDISKCKSVLMANISNNGFYNYLRGTQSETYNNDMENKIKPTLYDGIVISDKHVAMPVIDDEETLILEEESRSKMSEKEKDPEAIKQNISHKPIDYEKLNRLSEDFGKRFTPQQELSAEQAFWLRMSNPTSKPSDASPVKIEAPKELPKVSLVNESLKKLKFYLARFDNVVKIRTTPDARTEGCYGFFPWIWWLSYGFESWKSTDVDDYMLVDLFCSCSRLGYQRSRAYMQQQDDMDIRMDDPNITMEEYIRLEEEKAQKRGQVFNWETAKYGKIWYDEDIDDLRSIETKFPAIAFNDEVPSKTLSYEPTKNSFSYKIVSTNDLKTDSENDNEKVMPSIPSPEPAISCFDDLDFFKAFENEFPAIVYNDALTSKSDLLTEPILNPQHIDKFDLNDETSFKYDEE
ncbi:hypothetical protein Tco_0283032 [Tanacetum coccineum]